MPDTEAAVTMHGPSPPAPGGALVTVPPPPADPRTRPWLWPVIILVIVLGAGGLGANWWINRPPVLPPGFAASNGRLEADQIDISTKFAGRIAKISAEEGDPVTAGQTVALIDTAELAASLSQADALVLQAARLAASARADLVQQASAVTLADQELQRASSLSAKGFETLEVLDQRRSRKAAALAGYDSIAAKENAAIAAHDAAIASRAVIAVQIADATLVAPRAGRIEYRLANVGGVLPAGGKVFTMIDTGYVYIDVFLPTAEAGQVKIGAEARILLDAFPNRAVPAKVTFIAAQNQFTPKAVETKSERDKLMFRVRVRIDPDSLAAHAELARSGLPGVAVVRLDPHAAWPADIAARADR